MDRDRTRCELLEATERWLTKVAGAVARRTAKPLSASEIGQKVGRGINRYRVAKHFALEIADSHLRWSRKEDSIAREKALDGVYIIRTPEPVEALSAEDAVRAYKQLGDVEKAFRALKGLDLRLRPIHHRLEPRVRAHWFLCMLAYYVEWHMRDALAPLLFVEEDLAQARATRDPVAKAAPSESARAKKTADARRPACRYGTSTACSVCWPRCVPTPAVSGKASTPLVSSARPRPTRINARPFACSASTHPEGGRAVPSKRNGKQPLSVISSS